MMLEIKNKSNNLNNNKTIITKEKPGLFVYCPPNIDAFSGDNSSTCYIKNGLNDISCSS